MGTRGRGVVMVGMAVWMAVASGGSVAAAPPAAVEPVGRAATTTTVTQRQSIPAAAFVPATGLGMHYNNEGMRLTNWGTTTGTFYTAVRLPQGSTVTKFTFYWYDTSASLGASALLFYTPWNASGTQVYIARGVPAIADAMGYGSTFDSTITDPVIDNAQRGYWVGMTLPASTDVRGLGVVIEYTPPATPDAYFTLSAAAFAPRQEEYDYVLDGERLGHRHSPGGGIDAGQYYAPVRLPHGAVVARFTFYPYDNSTTGQARAVLRRVDFVQGNEQEMGRAETSLSGTPRASPVVDESIGWSTIDNFRYSYYVMWELPADERVDARGVVIEYQAPAADIGIFSSPAAPLKPRKDEIHYENQGSILTHKSGPGSLGQYVAAVRLPDGATIRSVSFHWYDASSTQQVKASLRRTLYALGSSVTMASGDSPVSEAPGFGSSSTGTIAYPTIDNASYGYYVWFELPPTTNVGACGLVVDLSLHVYLPVIARNRAW